MRKRKSVRYDDREEWYFSIVDAIEILTEQPTHQGARNYWKVLKNRLPKEGNETVTICNRLKLPAEDGKMRLTDVADTEQLFRLIQSIPSPKAEPFKLWMAQVAKERLDQMQYPESFDEHIDVACRGGNVAREARLKLEQETGKPVVTPLNAKGILELPRGQENKEALGSEDVE